MLKKKNIYNKAGFIILILFLCSCIDDNALVFNENINPVNNCFSKTISNIEFKNSKFYDDSLLEGINFKNDTFINNFDIKKIQNVKFTNSIFNINPDINFFNSNLKNVTFENCVFNSLWIRCSKEILNLNFINCKIDELVIDQSIFNSIIIESFKDTISKVRIHACANSKHIKFEGYFKEILIEGGEIQYLDVSNIINTNAKLTIFSTVLKNPNFVTKSKMNYSVLYNSLIENAVFLPDKNSILKEELEWDNKNTKEADKTLKTEIKEGYIISKSIYNYLSKIHEYNKKYDLSDYFYYRSKICESKINQNGNNFSFQRFFNEYIRGNYGTNYLIILKSFFIITLSFSLLYFSLGYFKFAFGYYIKTKLTGDKIENQKPVLLTFRKNNYGILQFSINCLLFSLNNMILGGLSNGFYLYNFTTIYLYPPRKYGAIGFGRVLSLIQSFIGLLLVFFFITAFLRLNR